MTEVADAFARFLAGDQSMLKCTVCKAQAGTCDCWTKCQRPGCKWSFRKGETCRNPDHAALTSKEAKDE